jgi:PAS domain S-box-containing protein
VDERIAELERELGATRRELEVARAEASEAREGRFFRKLVGALTDVISIVGADGRARFVAASPEARADLPPAASEGAHIVDLIHPDDYPRVVRALEKVRSLPPERTLTVEYRRRDAAGGWVHMETVARNFSADPDVAGVVTSGRNVTASVRLREQLRDAQARYETANRASNEAERMYRALFEDTSVAVTIRDVRSQKFIDCNSAALALYGLRSREELAGTTPDLLAAPIQADGRTAREVLRAYVERAIRDGVARMEWIGRRMNGEHFPADVRTTVIALEDGRRVMQTMIEDVTVRREAENALRYRARRDEVVSRVSRQFVQSAANVALPFALEALGTFLQVSRVRMRCFSADGTTLVTLAEWCAPDVPPYPFVYQETQSPIVRWVRAQIARDGFLAVDDAEALPAEVRALRPGPEMRSMAMGALLVVPLAAGESVTGWVVIDRLDAPRPWSDDDISTARLVAEIIAVGRSRSEAEAKIRQQSARDELLSEVSRRFLNDDPEAATDATLERLGARFEAERASVFTLDEGRGRLRCTHRWSAATGDVGFEPLEAYPVPEGALVPVDLAPSAETAGATRAATERWLEGLQRESGKRNLLALVGYGGRLFGVLTIRAREGRAWTEEDAGILRVIGELIAIGRVRRAAEVALERAKEDAVAASRTKSAFLANMSHELRTPLNGVIGMVDLLATTQLDARQRRYAEVARTSANLLLSVISDILDFSKIEAGKLEIAAVELDLDAIAFEVTSILRRSADEKALDLTYASRLAGAPIVLGDPDRLRQVLVNLVSNAIKFTRKGAIAIEARALSESASEIRVRVEVRDTGIGIPAAAQAKLFQPFTQVDASSTREHGGTGLGLAICRQLIESMRGTIGLTSAPAAGATFWFEVPLAKARAEVRDAGSNSRTEAEAPVRHAPEIAHVLIVEDSTINAEVAAEIVRSAGHTFDLAPDGAAAVLAAKTRPYDVVLMDCQLPEVDGYEASRRIRALEREGELPPRRSALPIIALTASATQGDLERCFAAGMTDHVSKPVDAKNLLAVIARHLRGRSNGDPRSPSAPPPSDPSLAVADLGEALARLQGNRALLRRIATQFAEGASKARAKLHDAVERRDPAAVAFEAHRLRGQASSFGGRALIAAIEALEGAVRRDGWTAAAATVLSVDAELDRLLRALASEASEA